MTPRQKIMTREKLLRGFKVSHGGMNFSAEIVRIGRLCINGIGLSARRSPAGASSLPFGHILSPRGQSLESKVERGLSSLA
jgi:hypothetical protein